MRKIVISGVAAALAFGLTACNSNDKPSAATPPSSPATSAPAPSNTPGETSTPGSNSTPGNGSNPGDNGGSDGSGGSGTPRAERTPPTPQPGQQINSKWGRLRYVAPGKFSVGNVVFFTSTDTRLVVAGGDCPDGTTPSAETSKCGIDGIDGWAQASPHNVNVHFSGQTATSIQETQ